MNLRGKILHRLSSPFIISLLISLVVYVLIPLKIKEYKTEQLSREIRDASHEFFYHDFDHDGVSEKIQIISGARVGIVVFSEGRVIDQWNFDGRYNWYPEKRIGLVFRDLDNDNNDEIILATFSNGKILLHAINPLKKNIVFRDRCISDFSLINDRVNTSVVYSDVYDSNSDGWNEIYFTLQTGHGIWPRGMRAYDIKHDSLFSSPKGCTAFGYPKIYDIDEDGIPEFFASSFAVGNCEKDDIYSDHYSWLMVFTTELKLKFNPVKTGSYPSYLLLDQYLLNNEKQLVGLQLYTGSDNQSSYIALFDINGKIIRKWEFEYSDEWREVMLLPQITEDYISVLQRNGTILYYNTNLDLVKSSNELPPISTSGQDCLKLDLDKDGNKEFIFYSADMNKIIIVRNDFSSFSEMELQGQGRMIKPSLKFTDGQPPALFVQTDGYYYTFSYYSNPFYPIRFLLLPGIYLIVLGFISLLNKLQKIRLEQKYKSERQLIELQLKSIKNQLDPHLTLNLLTSLGDLFDKKDHETANYVFSKYSTLLRDSILTSDQYTVTLDQELEFVENYLKLEKFRLDNRFDFEINRDSINSKTRIPKMLIHSFVENAVKHGIKHLEKEGRIEIDVQSNGRLCLIHIKDNGIGRKKSEQKIKLSTGKGLSIIDRIIESYNSLKKTKISYKINDLKNMDGLAIGTDVIVRIPL